MDNIEGKYIGESKLSGKPKKKAYPITKSRYVLEGDTNQEEINKRLWEAFQRQIKTSGTTLISDDGYWIVNGEKTGFKAVGEKGEDGKDGKTPLLRVSSDGMSLEISTDNGDTWLPFVVDFNKLRVIGYVDSISQLPVNAQIGDIYGVWESQPTQENPEAGVYRLYINTVKDWLLDYTITKVYDYDTELPSSATDGTAVLVPVTDLTVDKEKVDGYKVYRYNQSILGWTMVLNTAEIYADKEDIINYGDNVYALVQGAAEGTYELYKRQVDWVYFGTNASITYHLVQNVEEGTAVNILSGKAVKDAIDQGKVDLEEFKQWVKDTYGDYIENPEFIKLAVDNNDRILYGVQTDGNFYFGAGVPKQIIDYVEAQMDAITGIDDFDESMAKIREIIAWYDDLVTAGGLEALLAAINERIDNLEANKVDKEEGKSLIDAEYAEGVRYVENPELLRAFLDEEDRILEAIAKDGTKLLPAGYNIGGTVVKVLENPEFLALWLDSADHILMAVKADADVYYGCGVPSQIKAYVDKKIAEILGDGDTTTIIDTLGEITTFLEGFESGSNLLQYLNDTYGYYEDNPEYSRVLLDAEQRIIEAIRTDGVHVFGAGYELGGAVTESVDNPEFFKVYLDGQDHILWALKKDGDVLFGAGVPSQVKDYIEDTIIPLINDVEERVGHYTENPEFIDVKTDSEDKITEGTRTNGRKYLPAGVDLGAADVYETENPEYLEVTVDGNDRIINSIDRELEDIRYGGINLSEMKRDIDAATIEAGFDETAGELYTIENNDSTISLEMDDDWNVYEVRDGGQDAEITMDDETGDLYLEETISEI